jgi:uncharacterized SAM-binding protein YcdF (DUF218 family)
MLDSYEDQPAPWSRRRIIILSVAAALVLFCVAIVLTLLHVGNWLVVQDPLEPSKTIVVLSGEIPNRSIEAARIYRQNVAPQVWVSQGVSPEEALKRMNIDYIGEDFYNQKVLMALGVPPDAIRILEEQASNTQEEVDEIARDLRQLDAHSVIIVTSKAHSRRVRYIWKRRIGNDPHLVVRYANNDEFDSAHWWRHSHDALEVVREVLGMANAWAGFPLVPEPH